MGSSHPEECRENNHESRDCDEPQGNSRRRLAEIIFLPGSHVFRARQLQLGKFFFMNGDRNGTNRSCGGLAWDGWALHQDRRAWCRRTFRFPDLVSIDLRLPQASEVVGDGIFAIQAEMPGVGADESFVEHAARKLIELLLL